MPITINGSGTITGISTGGLPDGIIETADIVDNAITTQKLNSSGVGIAVTSINNGPLAGMRNAIINGNFDFWQRGTSFSGSSEYGADRWLTARVGTACTMSRIAFVPGDNATGGNPRFACRMAVTSVAGAANAANLTQRIESVRTFAGETITVSFWAKADAAKPVAVEMSQGFGTGGSPSPAVDGIGVQKFTLSTTWARYSATINVPSIAGKTLGTDGNDTLICRIWFDAGSNLNAITNTLGQQSGTFDIVQVQVESGPVATPFERRPQQTELALCQRYYQTWGAYYLTYTAGNGTGFGQTITYVQTMRAAPQVTTSGVVYLNASTININAIEQSRLVLSAACNNAGGVPVSVAATLALSAEL